MRPDEVNAAASSRNRAWHLVPVDWWRAQPQDADYLPEAFDSEGFIHLTYTTSDVIAVGNRWYLSSTGDWLALWIALDRCAAPVLFADADMQRQFPHLHGPLERDAILSIHTVRRAPDGTFLTIEDLPNDPLARTTPDDGARG